jgi:hypothetical protein
MLTISLHLDPDNLQDVAQAQRLLDRFNDVQAGTPPDESGVPVISPPLAQSPRSVYTDAIADLRSRIGINLREFVRACAEQEGEFSMADVAATLGQPTTMAVSRFASLGRSRRKTEEAVPAAPHLFEEVRPKRNGIWYFTMPEEYREIILDPDFT